MITNELMNEVKFLDRLHLSTNPSVQQSYKKLQTMVLLEDSNGVYKQGPLEEFIIATQRTQSDLAGLSCKVYDMERNKQSPWNDVQYNSWMASYIVSTISSNPSFASQLFNTLLPYFMKEINSIKEEHE